MIASLTTGMGWNEEIADGREGLYELFMTPSTANRLTENQCDNPHRAGSPPHQAASATNARFQVISFSNSHAGRYRDGSDDAQAARPFRIQSRSITQGIVRGNHRLKCARRALPFAIVRVCNTAGDAQFMCSCTVNRLRESQCDGTAWKFSKSQLRPGADAIRSRV